MVISTQISLDSSLKSLDLSSKSSSMLSKGITDKTSKEVNSMFDNSKSNSKLSDKNNDFKKIMDSKVNGNNSKNTASKDASKDSINDSIKDKFKSLKENINENIDDKEKVNKDIESLLGMINSLIGITNNDENLMINQEDMFMDNSSQVLDTSSLLDKLLDGLNSEEAESNLDSDLLSDMKDLAAELKLSNESKHNSKVLSLEGNNSSNQEELYQGESSLTDADNQNSETIKNQIEGSKEDSKEDKFLNSLLDDTQDNSINNKINMFASRVEQLQGQNTENTQLSVNKVTFTNDVIKDVKYMAANNIKELSVKVNPGNLGEITIKMIQQDGVMKAHLKANSKETAELLLNNISEIKKELSEQNMKISEVNIELYNDDTTYFKNGNFGGTFSGGQEDNSRRPESVNISSGKSINIDENEEIIDNIINIDNALDFLA